LLTNLQLRGLTVGSWGTVGGGERQFIPVGDITLRALVDACTNNPPEYVFFEHCSALTADGVAYAIQVGSFSSFSLLTCGQR